MHEQNAQLQRQSPGHPPNPPAAPSQHHIPEELQRAMEDTNSEIGVYLGIIYFVIEVFRHDETFGDELSESKAFLLTARVHQTPSLQWLWISRYRYTC